MRASFVAVVLCCLTGCSTAPTTSFNAEQQLRLQQLIHNVAKRQQVDSSRVATSERGLVIFSATFSSQTTTLLNEPDLMPAVLGAQSRSVELVISVAPGPTQLRELSHAMQLSLQLQQFLQDQQFNVSRRLQANSTQNLILVQLNPDRES